MEQMTLQYREEVSVTISPDNSIFISSAKFDENNKMYINSLRLDKSENGKTYYVAMVAKD